MKSYISDDIIFALATGWTKSALAIIRVSGAGCIEAFAPCFTPRLLKAKTNTLVYGTVSSIDEVVVAVYRDGHGYTGEEALEINLHGSLASISLMLKKLTSLGFRQAEPGEFTLRAFLNGKIDLTQAEAVNEIAKSQTRRSQELALSRLSGSLSKRIGQIRDQLLTIMGLVEVQLDYAEDEIGGDTTFPMSSLDSVIESLNKLSSTFDSGRIIGQGAKVVLAGATNAGKSSLFNLLLKQERSIVSSIAGTTRDFIESECEIKGLAIRLFDTAGLREVEEQIEAEGIKRTRSLLSQADLIIYLVDSSDPEAEYETLGLRLDSQFSGVKKLLVWNKTDKDSAFTMPNGFYPLSVASSDGFDQLLELICTTLVPDQDTLFSDNSVVIESSRQHQSLIEAKDALNRAKAEIIENQSLDVVAMELKEALDQMGYISGELTTDDILDRIFNDFCVGK